MKAVIQGLLVVLMVVAGVARAEVQIGKSFEFALVDKNIEFIDFEEFSLTSYHLGVGLSANKFFFSYTAEQSIRDDTLYDASSGFSLFDKYSRDDYSYTLGYSVLDQLSIYVGHKVGKLFVEQYILPANELRQFSFVDRGPFVGASYTQKIPHAGVVVLSAAYGRFDNHAAIDPFLRAFDGETTGFSYGLDWRYPFSENVFLRIGYKLHDYDMDVSEYPMVGERERPQKIDNFYLGIAGYY